MEYQIFDDSMRGDIEALQRLARGDLVISDRDDDDTTWLVAFDDDAGPVKYYTWDRAAKTATFLFDHRPRAQRLPAGADGAVRLHGARRADDPRLPRRSRRRSSAPTCPPCSTCTAGRGRATGGGWTPRRSGWPTAATCACRSTSAAPAATARTFLNAGDREWGAKMHDDLLDAVDHLVAQGIVDRERVAIYGGSYGGYAALIGATFTPDVFTCAISMVGPSNLQHAHGVVPRVLEADDRDVAQARR